jgi:hypothetical protein
MARDGGSGVEGEWSRPNARIGLAMGFACSRAWGRSGNGRRGTHPVPPIASRLPDIIVLDPASGRHHSGA